MKWIIDVNGEGNYIDVTTSGIADSEGSQIMAHAIARAMKNNRMTRVLVDHRGVLEVAGDTSEIFTRPQIFPAIGMVPEVKVAEVVRSEHLEHFKFFEAMSVNRGYQIRVFTEKVGALAWLFEA